MKKATHTLSLLLVLIGLAVNPLLARSAEVKGLYQASIAVGDRSDTERKRAIAEGFQLVLVRVSGDSGVSAQDAVAAAATTPDRYVVQYGYETRSASDGEKGGVYLNIQYDPNGVNNLLVRNSLPLWSSNRPKILIWMAWEQGLDRELVNANGMAGPFQILQEEGKRRGVSLKFPDFDPDDQSHVSLGDIWGMFPEPVLAASERYQTPVVVMAKVRETASTIQINAMLQLDGSPFWFEVARSDTGSALRQLMDQIVDKVGALYAVVSSSEVSQQVMLEVDGVTELKDYAALTRYLDGLLAINTYRTQSINGDRARFLVTPASGLDALEQTFRVDRKLLPAPVQPVTPQPVPVTEPEVEQTEAGQDLTPTAETTESSAPEVVIPSGPMTIRYLWRG